MRATPTQSRFAAIERSCNLQENDIWFLTETYEYLVPNEGYFSCFSGVPDRESKPGEKWSAIWSRWPMEALEGYVSDPARCVAGRIAETPFGEMILYGTVLPWNTDARAKRSSSYEAFAEALAMQKSDWLRLQQDFPNATLIVAGDFNQGLVDRHYYGSKKKQHLLESILKETRLRPLTAGAGDPIARDSYPRANIDHLCIASKGEWGVAETRRWPCSKVPDRSLSDHFGVSAKLRFLEPMYGSMSYLSVCSPPKANDRSDSPER